MQNYTASITINTMVNVTIKADSLEEALQKSRKLDVTKFVNVSKKVELIDTSHDGVSGVFEA